MIQQRSATGCRPSLTFHPSLNVFSSYKKLFKGLFFFFGRGSFCVAQGNPKLQFSYLSFTKAFRGIVCGLHTCTFRSFLSLFQLGCLVFKFFLALVSGSSLTPFPGILWPGPCSLCQTHFLLPFFSRYLFFFHVSLTSLATLAQSLLMAPFLLPNSPCWCVHCCFWPC